MSNISPEVRNYFKLDLLTLRSRVFTSLICLKVVIYYLTMVKYGMIHQHVE